MEWTQPTPARPRPRSSSTPTPSRRSERASQDRNWSSLWGPTAAPCTPLLRVHALCLLAICVLLFYSQHLFRRAPSPAPRLQCQAAIQVLPTLTPVAPEPAPQPAPQSPSSPPSLSPSLSSPLPSSLPSSLSPSLSPSSLSPSLPSSLSPSFSPAPSPPPKTVFAVIGDWGVGPGETPETHEAGAEQARGGSCRAACAVRVSLAQGSAGRGAQQVCPCLLRGVRRRRLHLCARRGRRLCGAAVRGHGPGRHLRSVSAPPPSPASAYLWQHNSPGCAGSGAPRGWSPSLW